MAGIGLELKKLSDQNTLSGMLRANVYAGMLSSGSWLISISVLVSIYFYLKIYKGDTHYAIQFLVTVTYIVSSALITSAIFQQRVNRYIADEIFKKRYDRVGPALFSSSFVLLIIGAVIGYPLANYLLYDQSLFTRLTAGGSFVTLNIIWLFANSLTGLKNYRFIVLSYLVCYALVFILAINLYQYQLQGLLFAFYVSHVLLMLLFMIFTLKTYPSSRFFDWDIFYSFKKYQSLIYGSIFFQLGVWIDKYCFWINPDTSLVTVGHLRASPIYDMPMFIAFLLSIPGITALFYDVEANFSHYYDRYYTTIREGGTLKEILAKQSKLVSCAHNCLNNIIYIQIALGLIAIFFAPELFKSLGLAPIFVYIFRINVVSICLLVLLIAQMNLLYYINKPAIVCYVCLLFFILNLSFTLLTFQLGPLFYGYGFALSLLGANIYAALGMQKSFKTLSYEAFMGRAY